MKLPPCVMRELVCLHPRVRSEDVARGVPRNTSHSGDSLNDGVATRCFGLTCNPYASTQTAELKGIRNMMLRHMPQPWSQQSLLLLHKEDQIFPTNRCCRHDGS